MNEESLAYWVGVAQTDGFLHFKKKSKNSDKRTLYVTLGVGIKSMSMMNKFRRCSQDIFHRNPKPFYSKANKTYIFRMGATRLKKFFTEKEIDFSDPPKPPKWVISDKKLFGAYLAGVIDGDGDVRVKRKAYPQCAIRITSGKCQFELMFSIIQNLKCAVRSYKQERTTVLAGRSITGIAFILEFYVSKKNLEFMKNFIVPHIAIGHKRDKIRKFVEKRCASAGI